MVNLPTVVKRTETLNLKLLSITPTSTEDGSGKEVSADEIKADFKHRFEFRSPLPKSASQVTMDTTLFIYSTDRGIVRLADRPQDNIPDNSVLSVSQVMPLPSPRVVSIKAGGRQCSPAVYEKDERQGCPENGWITAGRQRGRREGLEGTTIIALDTRCSDGWYTDAWYQVILTTTPVRDGAIEAFE